MSGVRSSAGLTFRRSLTIPLTLSRKTKGEENTEYYEKRERERKGDQYGRETRRRMIRDCETET
jgi:hypothetical protein